MASADTIKRQVYNLKYKNNFPAYLNWGQRGKGHWGSRTLLPLNLASVFIVLCNVANGARNLVIVSIVVSSLFFFYPTILVEAQAVFSFSQTHPINIKYYLFN